MNTFTKCKLPTTEEMELLKLVIDETYCHTCNISCTWEETTGCAMGWYLLWKKEKEEVQ